MAADLRYVYDLRTNHVFLEHKCNFRLDLMYYKSLLITHVLCCPQAQSIQLYKWCTVKTTLKSTLKFLIIIYDALDHGIRSWQEGNPDPQWPFPLPSDNDNINQTIFLAYTMSHQLDGHMHYMVISVYTGELPCLHKCSMEHHTTPSNQFNGLGHSSRP